MSFFLEVRKSDIIAIKKGEYLMKYKTKMKIYRFLGADYFQKLVFKVEKIKYKILDKYSLEVIKWYESMCDQEYEKSKDDNKTEDRLYDYQLKKLALRKEIAHKQNRNYHYNPNYPTKFVKHIRKNREIHIRGLIVDIIEMIVLIITFPIIVEISPILLGILLTIVALEFIKDFECINLQNYNLCRFENEKMKRKLEQLEKSKLQENLKNLSEGSKVVANILKQSLEVPTIDEVVEQVTTKKEQEQLVSYAKEHLDYLRENKQEKNKQKKLGGMK